MIRPAITRAATGTIHWWIDATNFDCLLGMLVSLVRAERERLTRAETSSQGLVEPFEGFGCAVVPDDGCSRSFKHMISAPSAICRAALTRECSDNGDAREAPATRRTF
jgi:hypothetical protein